jgi:hypothetical protein
MGPRRCDCRAGNTEQPYDCRTVVRLVGSRARESPANPERELMIRTMRLLGGTTETVESIWNTTSTAFFRGPAGAKINLRYGTGRWSVNRQIQTLDGKTIKRHGLSCWREDAAKYR